MFTLGNFSIDEILYAVAESFDGQILYSLDQLSGASIEISSESTDITDKNGNIVRTIYKSKTGTFNATNAFLHPQVMNAASGSTIETATTAAKIEMPKINVYTAGATPTLDETIDPNSLVVIGLYGSGANSKALTKSTSADFSAGTFGYDEESFKLSLPAAAAGSPVNYLVKYNRKVDEGMKLSNIANVFPSTVRLTLLASYVDPCSDTLLPCYVVLPSFQASPETTISLNLEEQEMDFSGTLQISYCESQPALYYIYFPGDETVVKVATGA